MPDSPTKIEYGVAYFWGLKGTQTFMTVQTDSIAQNFNVAVEVLDEYGRVVTYRLDDLKFEVNLEGTLKIADAIPENGTQFTYGDVQFILTEIEDKGTNKDFRKVSIKGRKYQEIE